MSIDTIDELKEKVKRLKAIQEHCEEMIIKAKSFNEHIVYSEILAMTKGNIK